MLPSLRTFFIISKKTIYITYRKKQWIARQSNDPFVKQRINQGYRSRASFKLLEIQKKHHLINEKSCVLDLGAAPGGWSQIVSSIVKEKGLSIAIDLLPIEPLNHVHCIQGDFTQQETCKQLDELISRKYLHTFQGFNVILSDMAPSFGGNASIDIPKIHYLIEQAFQYCKTPKGLVKGGSFVCKYLQGSGDVELKKELEKSFEKVVIEILMEGSL